VDRLLPRDELTYSLTNLLDRREDLVSLNKEGNATVPRLGFNYLEFLRVRLEQSYDLREANRNNALNRYSRRPVSDAMAETTVSPAKYLSLTQRTFYSPYLSRVTEHEHLAHLEKDDWGSVLFGLDFLEDLDEYKRQARKRMRMVRTGAELYISRRWSAGFDYRTDMVTDTDVEKTIYAAYKHQCFTLHLYYTKTPYEDRVEARIDLLGLSF
jgi:LPS-assembly protein